MVKSEVAKIMAILSKNYTKFETDEGKLELWFDLLKDIPYEVCQVAMKKILMEFVFPPTIADIRKTVLDITTSKENKLDSAEAWEEVQKAVRSFGWNRWEDAQNTFSPKTLRLVKMIGWSNICLCELEQLNTLRSQFMRMYDSVNTREKQDALLPNSLKQEISLISEKFNINTQRMLEN